MASLHKTFADGDVLDASSVNNALNPGVADHIPWAIHAQTITVTVTNSRYGDANLTFPSGRFTKTPTVAVTIATTSGDVSAVARIISTTPTTCAIRIGLPTAASVAFPVNVIAVQMSA